MALPGLSRDTVVVRRPAATSDGEGNAVGVLATVLTTRGTWGTPSYGDRQVAAQSGQQIDAVVAMATADVRPGDRMTVRSKDYEVTAVGDTRLHMRCFLRRVEG